MNSKILYILRGEPGSGKSTLATLLTSKNVAADDFPDLYKNGKYQPQKQSESHKWCKSTVQEWMKAQEAVIAVHNTFIEMRYVNDYIELAMENGYEVSVIQTEGFIQSDKHYAGSVHNVPEDVCFRMRATFEPLRQVEGNWGKEFTLEDVGRLLAKLAQKPDLILFDLDGTIIDWKTKKLTPELLEFAKYKSFCKIPSMIVSNQAGIQFGHTTTDVVNQLMQSVLYDLSKLEINIQTALYAPSRESYVYREVSKETIKENSSAKAITSKPDLGMFLEVAKKLKPDSHCWMVGDRHVKGKNEDLIFAQNAREHLNLVNKGTIDYIPIELLPAVLKIIEKAS